MSVHALPTVEHGQRHNRIERSGFEALAPREMELLRLYPELGTIKLMAYRLGISQQTVKNYATAIHRKLDVAHLGQAAVLFDRWEHGRLLTWPDVDRRRLGERRSGTERRG